MPKINKRPPITERSEAREDISSLMRLNWIEDASNNAVNFASRYPNDPYKTQATIELRDAARLLLELAHHPETLGPKDLGGKYVAQRAEQIRKHEARNPVERPNRHDWSPTNEEDEPPF
ncbi:hypothetical protein Moki_34 [Arthrobacter phage Moki]|uniref:Uncharacterized protein n=1 Tax=Arthrobacter phage Moki TaxID=2315609 RepID=A0A386KBY8_9CAUD|nr:hypothetical protein Moki_34 [Arthrobacter phage Moki]